MITLLHPHILPVIQEMPVGVLSLTLTDEEYSTFIIKVPKECILAAKINRKFQIYLVPIVIDNQNTFGMVTAFFDDKEEPLVIRSPLFLDDFSKDLLSLFKHKRISVHFFDELTRELLVYKADVVVPNETQKKIDAAILIDFSIPKARKMMDELETSFCSRTSFDDIQAISILLKESVYGENLFIQDTHPERHSYHGSREFSYSMLEREEPGSYQEEDIIRCLLLVFQPNDIYLNPKRVYDNEEMCDILVITGKRLLIIQAKDSPNIERISRQKLSRKRNNVLSALRKATEQVKGAVGYYRRLSGRLDFIINDEIHSVDTNSLSVMTLIVVKELFSD